MRIISPREFVDVVVMKQYEDGTMLSAGKAQITTATGNNHKIKATRNKHKIKTK